MIDINSNLLMLTDSYKLGHYDMYPKDTKIVYSYFESRGGIYHCVKFFGLQYILQMLEGQVVTQEKIDEAESYASPHVGKFNKDGWQYILNKHNGRLPVNILAVPEGALVPTSVPLIVVYNTDDKCAWLTNYLETLLSQVWYPSTVCTQSFHLRKIIESYLMKTVGSTDGVEFMLHDFGMRSGTSMESAAIGGAAHLVSFQGTDTVNALKLCREVYDCDMAGFSVPACYDDKTEVLTSKGFKFFSEVTKDDLIAEYNNDGNIKFVYPSKIYKCRWKGDMYNYSSKQNNVDMQVTPNHKMVRYSINKSEIELVEAEKCSFSHRNRLLQGVTIKGKINYLSDIDRFRIAFQADGSFPSHKEDYDGTRSECIPVRFTTLKKIRKVKRLRSILKKLKWEYNEEFYTKRGGYYYFWIKVPKHIKIVKDLSWVDISDKDTEWCKDFLDECVKWDGSENKDREGCFSYSSTNEKNADIVQSIACMSNYRANKSHYKDSRGNREVLYSVKWLDKRNWFGGGNINRSKVSYNGYVYCVSVPSKMLVTRRNNNIAVCGNTEHSIMTTNGREGEEEVVGRLIRETSKDSILSMVADSYNIYRFCDTILPKFKKEIESRTAPLVVRPDSLEPTEIVPDVTELLMNVFGYRDNRMGYRELPPYIRVIQGDGMDRHSLPKVLQSCTKRRLASNNFVFGCGSGLVQKLNRDDLKFAFKCSAKKDNTGWHDVYKDPYSPKGTNMKKSKKGLVWTYVDHNGYYYDNKQNFKGKNPSGLKLVLSDGVLKRTTFEKIRSM